MTIICGIQPTNVAMVMKLLLNSCNMCNLDFTDVCALTLRPVALVPVHAFS